MAPRAGVVNPLPAALQLPPQDLYVGLTPYSAPAVFGLLAGTELTDGVWYPRGGFQQVGQLRIALLGGLACLPLCAGLACHLPPHPQACCSRPRLPAAVASGVPPCCSRPAPAPGSSGPINLFLLLLHPPSLPRQIRDGLRRAAEACGVRVQLGAEVSAILTDPAGSRATGVALADGSCLEADIVVCNRDLASAYQLLEGLEPSGGSSASSSSGGGGSSASSSSSSASSSAPSSSSSSSSSSQPPAPLLSPAAAAYGRQQHERLGRLKYSVGVIAYNWSLGRRIEGLQHHNVFLSEPEQPQRAWQPATRPEELCRHPNFYVHVPSRTDPSAAPEGCDSVMVLLPVASQQQMGAGSDYAALIEAGRQRILQASGQLAIWVLGSGCLLHVWLAMRKAAHRLAVCCEVMLALGCAALSAVRACACPPCCPLHADSPPPQHFLPDPAELCRCRAWGRGQRHRA